MDTWGRGGEQAAPRGLGPNYLDTRELLWDGAKEGGGMR